MSKCLTTLGLTAWLLWSYGYEGPQWLIMSHSVTQAECHQDLASLGGPHRYTLAEPWTLRCYPVGVQPERVHTFFYDWLMSQHPPVRE